MQISHQDLPQRQEEEVLSLTEVRLEWTAWEMMEEVVRQVLPHFQDHYRLPEEVPLLLQWSKLSTRVVEVSKDNINL